MQTAFEISCLFVLVSFGVMILAAAWTFIKDDMKTKQKVCITISLVALLCVFAAIWGFNWARYADIQQWVKESIELSCGVVGILGGTTFIFTLIASTD